MTMRWGGRWFPIVLGGLGGTAAALWISLSATQALLDSAHAQTERAMKAAEDWKAISDRFEAVANTCSPTTKREKGLP